MNYPNSTDLPDWSRAINYEVNSYNKIGGCYSLGSSQKTKEIVHSSSEWTEVDCKGPDQFGGSSSCLLTILYNYIDIYVGGQEKFEPMRQTTCPSCILNRPDLMCQHGWYAACNSYYEYSPAESGLTGYLKGIPQWSGDCFYDWDCPCGLCRFKGEGTTETYCDCNEDMVETPGECNQCLRKLQPQSLRGGLP